MITPEPPLDAEEAALFQRGLTEFDEGYFFECHDTLEELWQGIRGPYRDFFQGLIQASVAFYHLSNENLVGARSMIDRSLARLDRYGAVCYGVQVEALKGLLRSWRGRLEEGWTAGLPPEERPRLPRAE